MTRSSFFFFLLPLKSLSSTVDGDFKIPLAVKDGDGQDKQETSDSRDFKTKGIKFLHLAPNERRLIETR